MNRAQSIELMIRLEGGYSNNPGDPGGRTKYGITQRTLDSLQGKALPCVLPKDVADLNPDQAEIIYGTVQWAQIHGDDLPGALAPLMLNAAVNQGEPTAIGMLQDCLGVPRDAVMGPRTLAAVAGWHSPYMPEQSLAEEFAARVGVHYATLNAKEGQYELGWFRRLMRVYTLAVSS
jgi:lysozyme family protein